MRVRIKLRRIYLSASISTAIFFLLSFLHCRWTCTMYMYQLRSAFRDLFRIFRLCCTHYIHFRSKNRTIIVIFSVLFFCTKSYHIFQNRTIQSFDVVHTVFRISPLFASFPVRTLSILQFCQIRWQKKRKHTSRTRFDQDNIVSISVYFSINSFSYASFSVYWEKRRIERSIVNSLSLSISLCCAVHFVRNMSDTKMQRQPSKDPREYIQYIELDDCVPMYRIKSVS